MNIQEAIDEVEAFLAEAGPTDIVGTYGRVRKIAPLYVVEAWGDYDGFDHYLAALKRWRDDETPAPATAPASNPQHYRETAVEPIDAIEAWGLPYNLGNVVKYLARAGRKGSDTRTDDLRKAADYLHREIHGVWPWEKEQPAP